MTDVATITVRPSAAAAAYARVDSGTPGAGNATGDDAGDFGATLRQALQGAVDAGHTADTKSMQALNGTGNLTEVVTAVARAQLALQSATAIRDRVVQAYQDIMKMPI
jgi:flagellar hook-basal body complex protein FliE